MIPDNRRHSLLIYVLLCAMTLIVYGQVADFDFTNFDDGPLINENPNVIGGLTMHGMFWALSTSYFDFWHPLTWWSHMLDCTLFGLDPGSHHLVNLGFHLANTLLLFAVLRQMTAAVWRSAFVAALFALHPLHVESVAWLSERKDVLSTLFFLLTLRAYVCYVGQPKVQSPKSMAFYGLALLFFVLALMSKPMVVTLPFVLLLLDYWPLGRVASDEWRVTTLRTPSPRLSGERAGERGFEPEKLVTPLPGPLLPWWRRGRKRGQCGDAPIFQPPVLRSLCEGGSTLNPLARRSAAKTAQLSTLVWEKLPFLALSVGSCIVTYLGMKGGQHIVSAEQTHWSLRLANVPVSYARYLGKLFWPVDLAALYPMPGRWGFWPVAGSVVLLLLITMFAARRARSAPWLITGWLMFLGTLVPVIGLVPNGYQSIADRYAYIPSIGLFVAVVWAVADYSVRWKFRPFLLPGGALVALLVCGSLTWLQAGCWRNSLTLWTHCVAVTRDNVMARISLGNVLQQGGQISEAMAQYREVLRLDPNQAHANLDLGAALVMTGQLEEATNCFARALRSRPDWSGAHLNLGHTLFALGDFSGALTHYVEAVRLDSNTKVAFTALAGDLSARGKSDEAVRYYLEALHFNPADVGAHYHLGLEWRQRGRVDEAVASFREAVRLEPDIADAHLQLADALANRRAISEAIFQYRETLRLDPGSVLALNNLAWILATRPEPQFRNGPEAVQLAEHACELTLYQQTVLVGTLAAAYAEAGRFDDAVSTAQTACALASERNDPGLLQKNRELLALYQARQPYREGSR